MFHLEGLMRNTDKAIVALGCCCQCTVAYEGSKSYFASTFHLSYINEPKYVTLGTKTILFQKFVPSGNRN